MRILEERGAIGGIREIGALMSLTEVLAKFHHHHATLPQKIADSLQKLVAYTHQIPLPAQGNTLKRWQILAQVAACDLSLAKLFESHLDAIAILHELGDSTPKRGIWAVWAAEGSPRPLQYHADQINGLKTWCSGAKWVDHALLSYRTPSGQSQLLCLDLDASGIEHDMSVWQACGMQHTATAHLSFKDTPVASFAPPDAYLNRVGFWHGAAGVAACWYGAAVALANYAQAATRPPAHPYKSMYLGQIATALSSAKGYFEQVAQQIDAQPQLAHELTIRMLRAHVEHVVQQVLQWTGQALGAAPYCQNAHFARLAADLPVFIRQSHAAFDFGQIGELCLQQEISWTL